MDEVRIVTNAHVVRNASSVRARSSFGPHVVNCCVEWISLPLDLALVRISEGDYEDFCKGWGFFVDKGGIVDNGVDEEGKTKELKLLSLSTTLPTLDSNVTAVGFPMGGTQISVTRGVVSRIDVDALNVCRIQIDAAINPG
jgi:S1-C subfamily serine protease